MTSFPEPLDLSVAADPFRVLRFGQGGKKVVAVHGITASGMAWRAVGRRLPEDWSLFAPDLRGRGGSNALPGPFGLRRHAQDVCELVTQLPMQAVGPNGAGGTDGPAKQDKVVLIGHSMGAYVALLAAASRPDLFERLILVDGGLSLPVPDGADLDEVLASTLGPALARLRVTYPSEQAYLDFFRAHPALGSEWNEDIEAYVRYDVTHVDGGVRSRASEEAVRTDGRDLLASAAEFDTALRGLTLPTRFLLAPAGMFGQPPGLLPSALVEAYRAQLPEIGFETVGACNHYTILLGPAAAVLTRRVVDPESWREPVAGGSAG